MKTYSIRLLQLYFVPGDGQGAFHHIFSQEYQRGKLMLQESGEAATSCSPKPAAMF